jgi:hypothetical protein
VKTAAAAAMATSLRMKTLLKLDGLNFRACIIPDPAARVNSENFVY